MVDQYSAETGAERLILLGSHMAGGGEMAARSVANKIELLGKSVTVYASPKIGKALNDLISELTFFEGVKLSQLLEAMYSQGKKDGARAAFEALESKVLEAEKLVPHKNPGQPRKRTK
jgi:hypothetical protein